MKLYALRSKSTGKWAGKTYKFCEKRNAYVPYISSEEYGSELFLTFRETLAKHIASQNEKGIPGHYWVEETDLEVVELEAKEWN